MAQQVYGCKRSRLLEVAGDFTLLLRLQRQALIAPVGSSAPTPLGLQLHVPRGSWSSSSGNTHLGRQDLKPHVNFAPTSPQPRVCQQAATSAYHTVHSEQYPCPCSTRLVCGIPSCCLQGVVSVGAVRCWGNQWLPPQKEQTGKVACDLEQAFALAAVHLLRHCASSGSAPGGGCR
jgi:hypothetical protein